MRTRDTRFDDLLNAASALAYSREQGDDSHEEWDDLNRAVLAADEELPDDAPTRLEFRGDEFVRTGTLATGAPEEHACGIDDVEQVGIAIAAKQGGWFVVDEVARQSDRAWITAHVAVEFLKRSGLVRDDGTARRLRATEGFTADLGVADFAMGQIKAREASTGR